MVSLDEVSLLEWGWGKIWHKIAVGRDREGNRKTSGSDWESKVGNPGRSETCVSGLDSTMSLAD